MNSRREWGWWLGVILALILTALVLGLCGQPDSDDLGGKQTITAVGRPDDLVTPTLPDYRIDDEVPTLPAWHGDRLEATERASRGKPAISGPRGQRKQGKATGNLNARVACESGGSGGYQANTGNGYYGGYQFDLPSWRAAGGSGYPHEATPEEQDKRARIWEQKHGGDPWPNCP